MTILELLTEKIDKLKENSQDEIDRIKNLLKIIDDTIVALDNEELLKDFDFSIAINLVNSQSFGIVDLNKCLLDVKNLLIAKYQYHQTYLSLSLEQLQNIKSFKERLGYLKEELETRINRDNLVKVDNSILENLEDFKNLLEGKGRRKYYTYEMIEAFFEVFNYDDFSYEDILELIKELEVSKNIKGKLQEEKVDFNEVKELFTKYLTKKFKINLLEKYKDEISYRINIENARNILEFFTKENLIDKFSPISLLQIAIYGKYDYINEFYYERVLPKNDALKKIYFDNTMSCVWINENNATRKRRSTIRNNKTKSNKKLLYSTIHEVCDDDVWENVRIIKENEDLLAGKYDLSNIDYLWAITKPTWLIKKNIDLLRLFGFSDVKLSAIVQSDLEDKIHFITELGLLNPPRNEMFREIEKTIPKYNEFVLNGKKKHLNTSILNYYPRNTSEIGKTSYTEYIYWFYKMQRCGKEEFYQSFFSSYMAGKRNKSDFYQKEDKEYLKDSKVIEKIIDDSFVTNYYDALIPNYDAYNDCIKEYLSSLNSDTVNPYFDDGILNDECVNELEKHMIYDTYLVDNDMKKIPNQYVYLFDKCIISRYKVLRNLSILKNKYGYLNNDMILTAVVRNSFIDKDTFELIKDEIQKGSYIK